MSTIFKSLAARLKVWAYVVALKTGGNAQPARPARVLVQKVRRLMARGDFWRCCFNMIADTPDQGWGKIKFSVCGEIGRVQLKQRTIVVDDLQSDGSRVILEPGPGAFCVNGASRFEHKLFPHPCG